MGMDAIDQTICPSVLGMTNWPHAIEHLVIPSTEGQTVWSIASIPINCILLYLSIYFLYKIKCR